MEPKQTKIINIPNGYKSEQRLRIAKDVIDFIRRRTADGLDVNNKFFASYSKNYEKSGTVNLKVTGDTLASISLLSHGKGFIRIGFDSEEANNKAAYVQAPRGQKASQPKRQFLGISQKDLNKILERYPLGF